MSSELESSSDRKDAEVEQGRGISPNFDGGNDTTGRLGRHSVFSTEEATRVLLADSNKSNETGVSNARNEGRVSDVKKEEETSVGVEALEIHPSSSIWEMETNRNRTDLQDVKLENKKKRRGVVEVYDSMLSDFDEFAAKDNGGAVGYGYEVGDMVWGKVKSHPWWPGHIYNEKYASVSVRKSKREGHVLVAFFGDSSYGWFLPAELVPFEQNFAEKSRQTNLRSFLIAVEEAMDEFSRRRNLGLACRCRNEFNFWPSAFEGEYLVDIGVGDEPGIYSSVQINKARDAFQPREMLSFMQQLAIKPRNEHLTIEFIKNKATALACRKSLFEEFDETYAQAFGTTPERPQRPTAPMTLDPSKAPLSGWLVVAEGLSKQNNSVRPRKGKDQMEKDKYQFKRRDEPTSKKPKKLLVGQAGTTGNPLLVDGSGVSERVIYSGIGDNMHQNYESACADSQHQPMRYSTSVVSDIKPSECSEKLFNSATKKVKVRKQPLVNLGSEHTDLVEKKKKKIKKEISTKACAGFVQLPVTLGDSGVTIEKVSGTLALHVPTVDNNCQLDCPKDSVVGSTSSQVEAQFDSQNIELLILLKDLYALALNPFHGMDRSCPGNVLSVFLKFRSLVYQKSLVLAPTESDEASEARASKLSSTANVLVVPVDGTDDMSMKPVKSAGRPGNSTKSGKKRDLLDRPEGIKKKIKIGDTQDLKRKRFDDLEEVKRMKVRDMEIVKKKKMVGDLEDRTKPKKINELEDIKKMRKSEDGKLFAIEKKPLQRPAESQRTEAKEVAAKNVPSTLKAALLESSKKKEQSGKVPNPTMLVMKFPSGAGLPSGAQLRARFARFGPMDHSATRIFWKSYTCRLVYRYMADAEAALKFVNASGNLFGSTNVRCYLRDMLAEAAEAESAKIQREDPSTVGTSQSRDPSLEQRIASAQFTPHPGQLKSCLKKPSIDEGGNGVGRGGRVKFVLDGEESSNNKQLLSGNKNVDNYDASFPEATSSSSYSVDVNSKNLSKFIVPPPPTPFHKLPINMSEQASARLYPSHTRPHLNNDISQEMLNLLNKCSDVVSNLTRVLGYAPYRAL
ncbi:PWWP domain-containing protein 1-like [Primulina huaijiensis]|uniref:PWWP domain-containing protein 1-like n=1 Tax=Primulina huaijiensis TaxID=1492673 RepID=UPI003CC7581C